MAARAMWKAEVRAGELSVPVKMYAAVENQAVHFRLLDPRGKTPVRQRMVDPETGEEVGKDDVRRGVETESGAFLLLDEEDLEALEPEASRVIEVSGFVPAETLDHRWYDRPYYLGPDGDVADEYFALARALRQTEREGIARWTMRNKRYVGALRWEGDHLLLMTLRHAGEVVASSALPTPESAKPTAAERKMAEQLVATLREPFDPERHEDEYRQRVLELVEAKREGKVIRMPERAPQPAEDESLETLLKQSVESAKGRRKGAA